MRRIPQAQRRLKQQQQQQPHSVYPATTARPSDFSSRLGAAVSLADCALRDISIGFAKTSASEAAVAQMM